LHILHHWRTNGKTRVETLYKRETEIVKTRYRKFLKFFNKDEYLDTVYDWIKDRKKNELTLDAVLKFTGDK
jgi:hypothetical protein